MLQRYPLRTVSVDRRLLGPVAIAGVWTLVALVAAAQAVALVRLDGRADLGAAIAGRLSIIPLWALATPLILRSARRFPVVDAETHISLPFGALHIALGSAFIVLANIAIRLPVVLAPVADGGGLGTLVRSTMQGVAEYYPPALVVYGVIVTIGHVMYRSNATVAHAPAAVSPAASMMPSEATIVEATAATSEPPGAAAVASTNGHITVRQWNRVHLLRVEDVDFVEAEDNYVVVHAASRTYKGRDRISEVESQLDPRRFVRIHCSTIVHVAKIREVQPLTHGDHAVILRDGTILRVARSRRQALGEALGVQL